MFIKGYLCGIYKITCLSTGKIYIGSSIHINTRWNIHRNELKGDKHHNPRLQNAWNKYGENNFKFEVIETIKPELLAENELKWFKRTNCCDSKFGFNIGKNPDRPMLGRLHTKESKLKMSMSRTGKIASKKTKLKMSISGKGRIFTKETKIKMSLASKGKKKSQLHIENLKKMINRRCKGSENPNSKLKDNKIIEIRKLHSEGISEKEISKIYKVSISTINRIINRKLWKHVK